MLDFLSDKFSEAFKVMAGKSKITEANIEETLSQVRTALLEADVNFKVAKEFVQKVKDKAIGAKVISGVNPGEQFVKIVHDELTLLMGGTPRNENVTTAEEVNALFENEESKYLDHVKGQPPQIVLVVGLNGQGKTTFTGKLAHYLKEKKKQNVYLVPADTFRPAAKEQLKVLASQAQVPVYDSNLDNKPAVVVSSAINEILELNRKNDLQLDTIIIDTAGRLHVDSGLMEELKDVRRVVDKFNPEVLLVADAMTGQEAVNVAKEFHEQIKLTGAVLSKMDSDAKGGAALTIKAMTGIPLRFLSTGEKLKDLDLFHADRMAKRILDMGDVLSLVEKAQAEINEDEAMGMMKNLEQGKFTIDDFLKQMEMMNRLGSMGSIMKMIPGMGGMMKQIGDLGAAETEMKRIKVMIQSMTKTERSNYKIIDNQRIERIAKGSGHKIDQVKDFLNKFKQMEKMMGGMMAMMKGGIPNLPGMPGMGQPAGNKKKGSGKGPWGNRYF